MIIEVLVTIGLVFFQRSPSIKSLRRNHHVDAVSSKLHKNDVLFKRNY